MKGALCAPLPWLHNPREPMVDTVNISKANTKFCVSLHYNGHESYLSNKSEIQLESNWDLQI